MPLHPHKPQRDRSASLAVVETIRAQHLQQPNGGCITYYLTIPYTQHSDPSSQKYFHRERPQSWFRAVENYPTELLTGKLQLLLEFIKSPGNKSSCPCTAEQTQSLKFSHTVTVQEHHWWMRRFLHCPISILQLWLLSQQVEKTTFQLPSGHNYSRSGKRFYDNNKVVN